MMLLWTGLSVSLWAVEVIRAGCIVDLELYRLIAREYITWKETKSSGLLMMALG